MALVKMEEELWELEMKHSLVQEPEEPEVSEMSEEPEEPDVRDLPGRSRSKNFTKEESRLLTDLVKERQKRIFGESNRAPKPYEARQAWVEVALSLSLVSKVTRTPKQCQKRYNDIRRRGKQKVAAARKKQAEDGAGSRPAQDPLTPVKDVSASMLSPEREEGIDELEVGLEDSLEDPEDGPSTPEKRPVEAVQQKKPACQRIAPPDAGEDVAFLPQQQEGFQMLQQELRALRRSTAVLSHHAKNLLTPLNRIASAVERLAERYAPPPTPAPVPNSTPFSTPSSLHSQATAFARRPRGRPRGRPRQGTSRM